jgi:hypothetical protein
VMMRKRRKKRINVKGKRFGIFDLLVFWPHSVFGQNHLSVKML